MTPMCENCWNKLTLCDECSRNAARYPERLTSYTPVVLTPVTGTLTMILESAVTATGSSSVTWESSVATSP